MAQHHRGMVQFRHQVRSEGHPKSQKAAKMQRECVESICREARSKKICLGNQVKNLEFWGKHRVRKIDESGI